MAPGYENRWCRKPISRLSTLRETVRPTWVTEPRESRPQSLARSGSQKERVVKVRRALIALLVERAAPAWYKTGMWPADGDDIRVLRRPRFSENPGQPTA